MGLNLGHGFRGGAGRLHGSHGVTKAGEWVLKAVSYTHLLLFDENSIYLFHQIASDRLGRPCIAPAVPRRAGTRACDRKRLRLPIAA